MLFNSVEFLIFFPLTTIIYFLIPHKYRWLHLLIASWVFYSFFIPIYSVILLVTIIIDYFAGLIIYRSHGKRRKLFLLLSIITNVGILCYFKYYNFFIENINELFSFAGIHDNLSYLNLALPIGLSFHTFQAMSYTIEVYRNNQLPEKHFGIYALYVMFYPQLVAGPIERPQNMLHQFHEKHKFDKQNCIEGFRFMLWGFFKKMVVADNCAIIVNKIFDDHANYSSAGLALGISLFAIQIYCDFSGYSDIAIGSAKVMGFKLMRNFAYPYFSRDMAEFWRRWHISLSTWFRDYIYYPLGGSKVNKLKKIRNTIIIFLLSGFWHGANWTFVIWGLINAIYFLPLLLRDSNRTYLNTIAEESIFPSFKELSQMVLTFILACIAWTFFRAPDAHTAWQYLVRMFSFQQGKNIPAIIFLPSVAVSILMFGIEWVSRKQEVQKVFQLINNVWRWTFYMVITMLILILSPGEKSMFIYFQF
jgi:alginate O-acetyltransferase complex protein AlgI